jgi:DNA-directed DNA polymerase III PolC
MNEIKKHYLPDRYKLVDKDFLECEEDMISSKDKEIIHSILKSKSKSSLKLDNPHNSIILYLLGITNTFDFNKERSDTAGGSPPDIDIDFDALEREKAVDWVIDHWGREHVAHIITHGTFKPKSIIKSFYRVTELPSNEMSALLKMVPAPKYGKEATLEEIVEASPGFKSYEPFYSSGKKLENMVSNFGIHAAGIVISDFPIHDVLPVWKNKKSERITQFNKKEVEDLGLIKFDFLSIDTLSIIKEAVRLIKSNHNIDIKPWEIPDGDPKAYAVINALLLTGMFQVETSGKAKDLIKRIVPQKIQHISDISALNRPGPAQAGLDETYITNKNNGYPPEDLPEVLVEILKDTHWTLVYQEQVMEIVSKLAGFTMREADDIRRAMGHKDKEVLASYQKQFVTNSSTIPGISESYAEDLWAELVGFADYCFNKSHSVAYSVITYVTAYLKANYPTEFFCALMTVRSCSLQPKDWASKAPEYINEATYFQVEINPPSVNASGLEFSLKENEIYFGLSAIRDVGITASRSIIRARGNTPYKSVFDFLHRVNLSKVTTKTFIALVRSGAFDKMGYIRSELEEKATLCYEAVKTIAISKERDMDLKQREIDNQRKEIRKLEIAERLKEAKAFARICKKNKQEVPDSTQYIIDRQKRLKEYRSIVSQAKNMEEELCNVLLPSQLEEYEEAISLRKLPSLKPIEIPDFPSFNRSKTLELDLSDIMQQAYYIGCYIQAHPAKMIGANYDKIENCYIGQRPTLCGVVTSIKEITTKRTGAKMAFMEIDDSTGFAEIVIFPNVWSSIKDLGIKPGVLLSDIQCIVDNENPVKLKLFKLKLYRSYNE